MPLVLVHKADRVWKAKQKKAGRDASALRRANRIADAHVGRFARVFRDIQRELIDDEVAAKMRGVLRDSTSIEAVLATIPWYEPGQPSAFWDKAIERIVQAYADVLQASGDSEAKQLNEKLKTTLQFQLEDTAPVEKAAPKKVVPIAPVNPYAKRWIKQSAGNLIQQHITRQQKATIRDVLLDSFSKGQRAETIVDKVRSTIGLTTREAMAVENRRILLEDKGWDVDAVRAEADDYAEELRGVRAERIARTETIAAQAEGRNEVWRLAQESGTMPPVVRVWVAIPSFGATGRTCEICEGLDGTEAAIGEAYETDLSDDVILHPPAHPNCRCTEILQRAEGEEE
jgi:hypothetical protein